MTDIVEWLRRGNTYEVMIEAADEIERLRRERDEARVENRKWEKVAEAQENVNAKLIGKLTEARRERDEAREALREVVVAAEAVIQLYVAESVVK